MKVHEYQAKELLAAAGANVPRHVVCKTPDQVAAAFDTLANGGGVMVKAQIHAGGRGAGQLLGYADKLGGVKFCSSKEKAKSVAELMLKHPLKTLQTGPQGQPIQTLIVQADAAPDKEFYVAVVFDRAIGQPVLMASAAGGMDIEKVAHDTPELIFKMPFAPETGLSAEQAKAILDLIREIQEGDPLLVMRDRGSGRVSAFLTSAGPQLSKPPAPGESNQGWNEWANGFLSATYPILIQDSLLDLLRATRTGQEFRPMSPIKIALARDRYDPETKAMFLSQVGSAKGSPPQPESVAARVTQSPDATGPAELVFSNTNQPGYFSVTLYPKGQRMAEVPLAENRGIPVNVDTTESDLRRASKNMLTGSDGGATKGIMIALPGDSFEAASDRDRQRPVDASETPWIFLAILIVLIGEQAMALRVSHLRSEHGPSLAGGRR